MKIAYAPRALRDVEEILAYTHNRSPRGAHNVSIAIEHAIRMCALHPNAAAQTDEANVRRRPLGKYRYTIFFRALAGHEGIEVIRVVRSARVRSLGKVPEAED
jgi:plasmid stabilization system protein ParE